MYFKYKDININYELISGKGDYLVFLHGWGGSIESFKFLAEKLGRKALLLDFPPFGKSDELQNFDIYSYADMVYCLCKTLNIDNATFICHSFGGRVGIILASIYKSLVKKLILIDSAGIKPRRKLNYYFKLYKYKLCKKLNIKLKNYGSQDYKSLTPNMRKTFVNVVNCTLEERAKDISCNVLLIYGSLDKDTPVYMARKLNKLICGSKLYIVKNAGHFCYIDKFNEVQKQIENFLEE